MSNKNKASNMERDSKDWRTPGILLRRARREKGLGVDQVCDQLGMTQRMVKALESDDYDKLPGEVYLRGYIKRYSAVLGLEEEPLLACFDSFYCEVKNDPNHGGNRRDAVANQTGGFTSTLRRYKNGILAILGVVIAIGVVLWATASQSRGEVAEMEKTPLVAEAAGNVAIEDNMPAEDLATAQYEAPPPKSLQAVTSVSGPPPDPGRLDMQFDRDSWVEVVDAKGDILVVDLKRAGSQLQIEGKPPFNVLLGYAAGVTVNYLNEPVSIHPQTGSQTARLVIGK